MENNYKSIDEAVFELQDVKRGKKSIFGAFCALALGVMMIAACYVLPQEGGGANVSSTLLLCGVILAAAGAVLTAVRLGSKNGAPYYIPTGKAMKRFEVFYDDGNMQRVLECLESGAFDALSEIPKGDSSAAILVCYRDRDGRIAMCQLQRYVPHCFVPVHQALVFAEADAARIKSIL